ncbi:MAG: hypothetical protein ACYTG2_18145 [Planctomycetota bacterium]|jgi:hypothetical protein
MTLSLRDVMEHVLAMPPGSLVYLDRRTGALRLVTEEISEAAGREVDMSSRPDWERELIQIARLDEASERYVPLPALLELDEYETVGQLLEEVDDVPLRDRLFSATHGADGLVRFTAIAKASGFGDRWDELRRAALADLLRERLGERGIPFEDDVDEGELKAGTDGR